MKIKPHPLLTPLNKIDKQSAVAPKFAQRLRAEHGDKAFYSLEDETLKQIREAYARGDEEASNEALKTLGEGWGMYSPGHFSLVGDVKTVQELRIGLEDGSVSLETHFKQPEENQYSYHREILSADGEGKIHRETPEVYYTHLPKPDDICHPVDELFQSDSNAIAQTYYRPACTAASMQNQIADLQAKHNEIAPQRAEKFGKLNPSTKSSPEVKKLESEAFHLLHHPQNVADGLYRARDFYISPGHLQAHAVNQGWEVETDSNGQKVPVVDAVVVGAGPGGLSTAHQLARRGARVVTFEAEIAGASFSDAGAKSVHHLRTSTYQTNLLRDGFDYISYPGAAEAEELEHPASLLGRVGEYEELAKEGREALKTLTDNEVHDIPSFPYGYGDGAIPATRGMFFAHMSKMADSLANDFSDSILCERSPVQEVGFEDGFYTVSTARGHKVKTKNLVLATGLTGSKGENTRGLSVLGDFATKNPSIFENLSDESKLPEVNSGPMLLRERSLGNQAVRQSLSALPDGSRAAMVGSGESALKGALELLHLNPGLSVDLFVKGPVETQQVQIPPEYFRNTDAILMTPNSDERARSETERYGSPLTPRSLQLFLELQAQGRARLFEMGEYFDENSVNLGLSEDSKIEVDVTSTAAKNNLESGAKDFQSKGLLPQSEQPAMRYDTVVQAVGYKPPPVEKLDFLKQLNLPAEAAEGLHINTAGAIQHQVHTTIPGLAISGRMVAEEISKSIPTDRLKELIPRELPGVRVWDYRTPEQLAEVPFYLESGGILESGYDRTFKQLKPDFTPNFGQISSVVLNGGDRTLREIYDKPTAERTPAEQEVLERGVSLGERMRGLHLPTREEAEKLHAEGRLREVIENGPDRPQGK